MILGIRELSSLRALKSLMVFTEAVKGTAAGSVQFGLRVKLETWLFVTAHRCCKGNRINPGSSSSMPAQF